MTPFVADPDFRLYQGDALTVLRELEPESVDCCVTSPPYWGLRDYGMDGQLGLEATPELFVAKIVEVFREVRRVLAPHGTCWVNLGDSYNGSGGFAPDAPANQRRAEGDREAWGKFNPAGMNRMAARKGATRIPTLKPKDLVGIPWRVAFALQADGWWLRSDIVWSKPNPMPESVTDRPTKAHEYVFLLTKQPKYFFDQEAVREKYQPSSLERERYGHNNAYGSQFAGSPTDTRSGKVLQPGEINSKARGPDGRRATGVVGQDGSAQHRDGERWPNPTGRNVRSVWEIATQPYPDAHFATFPEELARRCILAGCPEQVCQSCGKPRERLVSVEYENPGNRTTNGPRSLAQRHEAPGFEQRLERRSETLGWSDCECADYRSGVVLDPFLGSGTTALVARNHGRRCVGIELSPEYAALAARRCQQLSLLAGAV